MDAYLLLALILLIFLLGATGPSFLQRERWAWRSAAEIVLCGAILMAVAWALQIPSPLYYLLALYLITMRSRLLVDIANALAARHRAEAFQVYRLAFLLASNPLDRARARINEGAALLHSRQTAAAVSMLCDILAQPGLGIKLEAACRCNLGLAYLRQGELERGRTELRRTVALMPASIYGQRARLALQRIASSDQPSDAGGQEGGAPRAAVRHQGTGESIIG